MISSNTNTTTAITRGSVRCGKLNHTPDLEGYIVVNCCSTSKDLLYKQLSPMILGPYEYEMDETDYPLNEKHKPSKKVVIHNLENFWQFSKVWEGEEESFYNEKTKTHDTRPGNVFFERRVEGWNDKKPHRWVKKGEQTLYAWWHGEKLNYMNSRRRIYCPLYAEKVVHVEGFKKLQNLLNKGHNILILGYDGYDYHGEGMTLQDCFNDVSRPFGHELVLCGLLTNDIVWT